MRLLQNISVVGILFLQMVLSWLIFRECLTQIDGLLWTSAFFELLYVIIRAYHDFLDSMFTSNLDLVIVCLQIIASFMIFLLFRVDGVSVETKSKTGCRSKDQASFFSRLFATWLARLFAYGKGNSLEMEDLPALPRDMESSKLCAKFDQLCSKER